jgi:hypothetical protein
MLLYRIAISLMRQDRVLCRQCRPPVSCILAKEKGTAISAPCDTIE